MKIKKLTIENVASIESAEIDFEHGPLAESPLFLICGETGSGKTTILDCITLALYGKTPRYSDRTRDHEHQVGNFAYNDPLQLVRRGARKASAKLALIGNDGKSYEATWSATGGQQERTRDRLTVRWTWRDCSPGGLVFNSVGDVRAVSLKATGLDFDQFCRTTMLAQGQFSKFLLGSEADKAEILEKLTNTSKYTKLGKAIADKYGKLAQDVTNLETDIAGMEGLGAQRPEVEGKVAELTARIAEFDKQIKTSLAKLQWLQRRHELEIDLEDVKSDLKEAYASLKAYGQQIDREIQEAEASLADLRQYLEDSSDKSMMFKNASVILTNLEDVRSARKRKKEAAVNLSRIEAAIPELEKRIAEGKSHLEQAKRDVSEKEREIASAERELESMCVSKIRSDKSTEEKRCGNLKGLSGRLIGLETLKESIVRREERLVGKRNELERCEAELPAIKLQVETAREELVRAKQERDKKKQLIDAGIEKLVAELRVGDICPVCGNRIAKLHAEGHFRELFASLNASCAAADANFADKERIYNSAKASADGIRETIDSETRQATAEQIKVQSEGIEISDIAKTYGLKDASCDGIKAAILSCNTTIETLDRRLADAENREKELKVLRNGFKKLDKVRESAKDAVADSEQALDNLRREIKTCKAAIEAEDVREKSKLTTTAKMVSVEGWLTRWEQDSGTVEQALKDDAQQYQDRILNLPKVEARCDALAKTKDQIADCSSRAVAVFGELNDVDGGQEVSKSTAEVEGLLGHFEGCANALKMHAATCPNGLDASETVETLGTCVGKLKNESDTAIGERGKLQQQLEDDEKCARDRQKKNETMQRLIKERDEWKPLYDNFGDNDGKKIRLEIQAYVLSNVLIKANYYLKQLSDRYKLSCEGLMLSVIDGFEGCVVRPVNTLSGGEQFLVSLALALGLAGMNDSGLSVDMLFIDEGFGTLSGDHLRSAIEALERLNALTGSHKVGVISHVERLRERIPTHIEVSRTGHDPSEVKIVVNGRKGV